MMNKLATTAIFVLLLFTNSAFAGDTLRVMHYNLMYYDNYTSIPIACNATTNNVDLKDDYLSTIINHTKPDIFTANEINSSIPSVQRILTNTLNVNGITHYKRGSFSGSDISNMLYYNSDKLVLKSQTYIQTEPRITDVYRLYYKPELTYTPLDTIYITCFVIHPKASNDASSRDRRTAAANQIMNYITTSGIQGNVMLLGDLNIYYSTEGSFQAYTTATPTGFRFYDPINEVGYWNDNSSYAHVHTQSTHTSGSCFASGGMDDRFDFILTSLPLLQESNNLRYVANSYKALGQDGNRFNGSLISPSNTSLPANVISALYNMSDHLPVTLKLFVNTQTSIGYNNTISNLNVSISNPVTNNLVISTTENAINGLTIQVFDMLGNAVENRKENVLPVTTPVSHLRRGIYLVKVSNGENSVVKKIIKQ